MSISIIIIFSIISAAGIYIAYNNGKKAGITEGRQQVLEEDLMRISGERVHLQKEIDKAMKLI